MEVAHGKSERGIQRDSKREKAERGDARRDSLEVDSIQLTNTSSHRLPEDASQESEETALEHTNTPWARRPLAWSRLLM